MANPTNNIRCIHRPLYDGLTTAEEKAEAMTAEVKALQEDNSIMDFAAKTSLWVAYERFVESQRDDRLFNDPLAQYLYEPYGQRLSDAFAFGLTFAVFDPPGANIGFGLEGHVTYTACRTKLVNEQVTKWLQQQQSFKTQVLNLGVGTDTRAFWLDCLKDTSVYWEIDQASVMNYKEKVVKDLEEQGKLPDPLCPRRSITMDFSEESIQDLPTKYDFDRSIPTCWILEGLIMYLPNNVTKQLLKDITDLSAPGSLLILNFANSDKEGPSIDEIDQQMEQSAWKCNERIMFGEEGFNYGRYPTGKPANLVLGFAMYQKNDN